MAHPRLRVARRVGTVTKFHHFCGPLGRFSARAHGPLAPCQLLRFIQWLPDRPHSALNFLHSAYRTNYENRLPRTALCWVLGPARRCLDPVKFHENSGSQAASKDLWYALPCGARAMARWRRLYQPTGRVWLDKF